MLLVCFVLIKGQINGSNAKQTTPRHAAGGVALTFCAFKPSFGHAINLEEIRCGQRARTIARADPHRIDADSL